MQKNHLNQLAGTPALQMYSVARKVPWSSGIPEFAISLALRKAETSTMNACFLTFSSSSGSTKAVNKE